MNRVFSESTIILSFFKGNQLKKKIVKFLNDNKFYNITASYCILETMNIMMTQTEYLIKKIKKFKSLNKAQEFIVNALSKHQHAYIKWSCNLLRNIYGDDDKECTERALLSLNHLRLTCYDLILSYFDDLVNRVECDLYKNNLRINLDEVIWNMPKCKVIKKQCRIQEFFEKNKKIFEQIKCCIDQMNEKDLTDELIDFSKTIEECLNDSSMLFDYKNGCRKISDLLIALESKQIKNFFTQNYKESKVICKILKQKLFILSNNFEKEIETHDFNK